MCILSLCDGMSCAMLALNKADMLGDDWTVAVIADIFKGIKELRK